jgi:hypothetical protein
MWQPPNYFNVGTNLIHNPRQIPLPTLTYGQRARTAIQALQTIKRDTLGRAFLTNGIVDSLRYAFSDKPIFDKNTFDLDALRDAVKQMPNVTSCKVASHAFSKLCTESNGRSAFPRVVMQVRKTISPDELALTNGAKMKTWLRRMLHETPDLTLYLDTRILFTFSATESNGAYLDNIYLSPLIYVVSPSHPKCSTLVMKPSLSRVTQHSWACWNADTPSSAMDVKQAQSTSPRFFMNQVARNSSYYAPSNPEASEGYVNEYYYWPIDRIVTNRVRNEIDSVEPQQLLQQLKLLNRLRSSLRGLQPVTEDHIPTRLLNDPNNEIQGHLDSSQPFKLFHEVANPAGLTDTCFEFRHIAHNTGLDRYMRQLTAFQPEDIVSLLEIYSPLITQLNKNQMYVLGDHLDGRYTNYVDNRSSHVIEEE